MASSSLLERLRRVFHARRSAEHQAPSAPRREPGPREELQAVQYTRIVERYNILVPFVLVTIVEDPNGKLRYIVSEPSLSSEERRYLQAIRSVIEEDVNYLRQFSTPRNIVEGLDEAVEVVEEVADKLRLRMDRDTARRIGYYIARDFFGYGEIDPMVRDPQVEDITCNGVGAPIHVYHARYDWLETNKVFRSVEELESIVRKLAIRAGIEPSVAKPIVEGVLRPEGFRVHITLDVVSRLGHSFTIRKFRVNPFTVVDLINLGTIDPLVAAYLWMAVEYKQGVIIYGPTGAGKTTLLNAISMFLPPEYKIVSAEDTPEIHLPHHPNWIPLVTRESSEESVDNITLVRSLESALRQRPDVILLGEIRSREAYAFFQAVATGHGGITTVHGESIESLIRRLTSDPLRVPKSMVALVRSFVFITHVVRGSRRMRKVVVIHESHGYDSLRDEIVIKDVIVWDRSSDRWVLTRPRDIALLRHIASTYRLDYDDLFKDLKRRATVLKWAATRRFDQAMLHKIVRRYMRSPEEVYQEAVIEVGEYEIAEPGA